MQRSGRRHISESLTEVLHVVGMIVLRLAIVIHHLILISYHPTSQIHIILPLTFIDNPTVQTWMIK